MFDVIILGISITLLIVGGGAFAWWQMGRSPKIDAGKQRHREEARRLQIRFDTEDDFTRNFHRPTQNEVLETLQTLDQLMPDWEQPDASLADQRFKNELAENFPTLRKSGCAYPAPISEDIAHLSGKAKLTPEILADRLHRHAQEMAGARARLQAVRAQANAMHQITSGVDAGPLELTPGSLPFRPSEGPPVVARRFGLAGWATTAAVATCIVLAALYVFSDAGLRNRFQAVVSNAQQKAGSIAVPAMPTATGSTNPPAAGVEQAVPTLASPALPSSAAGSALAAATAILPPETTAPAPVTTPAVFAAVPAIPPLAKEVPSTLAQQIAASQLRAVDKYPDLAVPNSELNLRFVFRYKNMLAAKSSRLDDPLWPEKLADECAAAIGASTKTKKFTQAITPHR